MEEALENAVIAWSVCASVHREFGKRDALFTTRQADFVRHENEARQALALYLTGKHGGVEQ